jgi:hypothetical protein
LTGIDQKNEMKKWTEEPEFLTRLKKAGCPKMGGMKNGATFMDDHIKTGCLRTGDLLSKPVLRIEPVCAKIGSPVFDFGLYFLTNRSIGGVG